MGRAREKSHLSPLFLKGGCPLPPGPPRLLVFALVIGALSALPGTGAPASEEARGAEAPGPAVDELPYELQEVAPGVWAALQPAALRFHDSNSLVIETDRGVVVVDSQSDPAKVRLLAAEIRRRTGQEVRFVISTHWHGDHTQGNGVYREVFGEDVRFLAHSTWWRDVRDRALPQLAEELDATRAAIARAEERLASGRSEDGGEMSEVQTADLTAGIARAEARVERLATLDIPTPTLTFADRLTLHLTWQGRSRPIRLIHLRGHTRGDVVVHLPTERLLATGDLLDDLPFGGHGYPEEWIRALDTLDALDFETVVPGHGPVQEGRRQLGRVRTLLTEIVTRAKAGVRRGEGPETAKETAMASEAMRGLRERFVGEDPLAGRAFDAFVPATFERAFLEAKGELPD